MHYLKIVHTQPNYILIIFAFVCKGVIIFCFLCTISTAFEYKLDQEIKYIDKNTGENCTNVDDENIQFTKNTTDVGDTLVIVPTTDTNIIEEIVNDTLYNLVDDEMGRSARGTLIESNKSTAIELEEIYNSCQPVRYFLFIDSILYRKYIQSKQKKSN